MVVTTISELSLHFRLTFQINICLHVIFYWGNEIPSDTKNSISMDESKSDRVIHLELPTDYRRDITKKSKCILILTQLDNLFCFRIQHLLALSSRPGEPEVTYFHKEPPARSMVSQRLPQKRYPHTRGMFILSCCLNVML